MYLVYVDALFLTYMRHACTCSCSLYIFVHTFFYAWVHICKHVSHVWAHIFSYMNTYVLVRTFPTYELMHFHNVCVIQLLWKSSSCKCTFMCVCFDTFIHTFWCIHFDAWVHTFWWYQCLCFNFMENILFWEMYVCIWMEMSQSSEYMLPSVEVYLMISFHHDSLSLFIPLFLHYIHLHSFSQAWQSWLRPPCLSMNWVKNYRWKRKSWQLLQRKQTKSWPRSPSVLKQPKKSKLRCRRWRIKPRPLWTKSM